MAPDLEQNRFIVITGFMASGKTTVARVLAALLNSPAIDLDLAVTEREGRTPSKIIEQDGEEHFRRLEGHALTEALKLPTGVLALGGGAWTLAENRKAIDERAALTVWLDVPFELCWSRIRASEASRPLAPNRENAERLFEERRSYYQLAQVHLKVVEGESPGDVAHRIATLLTDTF